MRTRFLAPLLLVLVPAVAAAQRGMGMGGRPGRQMAPGQMATGMMMRGFGAGLEGGPAQRLLEQKAELGLTDEQVGRLEALAKEWEASHAPLRTEMEQMREARAQLTEQQRERMLALREQAQSAGENARQGIEDVLTEEQRQKLGNRPGLMQGGRGGAMMRRGGMGRGAGAFGAARVPGFGRQLVPGARMQAPIAPRLQARPFFRGGFAGPGPLLAPRAGMLRRAPVLAPAMQWPRRRWMDQEAAS